MKLIAVLFFLLFAHASAQTFSYELQGLFPFQKSKVAYTLRWNEEENGVISGKYADNLFQSESPVRGDVSESGRTFIVELSRPLHGVGSLVFLSGRNLKSQQSPEKVSVSTRDLAGAPLATFQGKATYKVNQAIVAQRQEESDCLDGFGALGGFCGLYAGLVTEDEDRKNKCNLLFADAVRMELNTQGTLTLLLGEPNELSTPPVHTIGRLPFEPQKESVDLVTRVCAPLVGVNLPGDSCKLLHLEGQFSKQNERRKFKGSYTVTQEGTRTNCRYLLSLSKQFAP